MKRLARLLFRLAGWSIEGAPPPAHRFVLIAAPHTSNWDALIMVGAARLLEIDLQFLIKDSWFVFPMGTLLRAVGGIPVDRSARHGLVDRAVEQFRAHDRLILAVPPEGTRGRARHWKTGFYHIARGAKVPIVLGYLDYRRKVAGLGPAFTPSGDLAADFEYFRAFYAQVTARFPDQVGPIAPPPGVAESSDAGRRPLAN